MVKNDDYFKVVMQLLFHTAFLLTMFSMRIFRVALRVRGEGEGERGGANTQKDKRGHLRDA